MEPFAAIETLLASRTPVLIVLAGSKGAGKTTFFEEFLERDGLEFVNADRIAAQLVPRAPSAVAVPAARAAEIVRRDLVASRRTFVMETVFSDRKAAKLAEFQAAKAQGYAILLIFIGIDSPELSEARVLGRVAHGGHDVPSAAIRDRFPRTLANLAQALAFVDVALLFDNSDAEQPFKWVATWKDGEPVRVVGMRPGWYPQE